MFELFSRVRFDKQIEPWQKTRSRGLATMEIIPPLGYITVSKARNMLMRCMHSGKTAKSGHQGTTERRTSCSRWVAGKGRGRKSPSSYSKRRLSTVRTVLLARYANETSRSGAYRTRIVPFH